MNLTLLHGDCREVMASLDECSVDSIVCDPPYGLEFMGKDWDKLGAALETADEGTDRSHPFRDGSQRFRYGYSVAGMQEWHRLWAVEAFRVLKPGGHMVAFSAPRTYHRMAVAIEDAGFEIRDCLMWLFGSGFPKSLDVSKALDKAAGAEREITGTARGHVDSGGVHDDDNYEWQPTYSRRDAPATDLARAWEGWGTALKPAYEPIVLARKPLQGTVAGNVERWGTGGLNIDATRIGTELLSAHGGGVNGDRVYGGGDGIPAIEAGANPHVGRWPANVLLDAEAARLLDAMSGELNGSQPIDRPEGSERFNGTDYNGGEAYKTAAYQSPGYLDRGGASRFFYTAKASRSEREFGLDDLDPTRRSDGRDKDIENPRLRTNERRNDHPTVKPLDLMRWLCRLITPPNGTILDPFMGSGSTGMAALDEGFWFIGIDMDEHYIEIARRRIERRHLIEPLPQREAGQGVLL